MNIEISLIIIVIALIIQSIIKDVIHAKHLERLELRLKGIEPTETDNLRGEEVSNSILNESYVDLSMVDADKLAAALDRKAHTRV